MHFHKGGACSSFLLFCAKSKSNPSFFSLGNTEVCVFDTRWASAVHKKKKKKEQTEDKPLYLLLILVLCVTQNKKKSRATYSPGNRQSPPAET
ncbi:hypothetical protein EK904_006191 [Melospiza melodia maxima]|nr:hypothetical protein EK904_006191 [Melospiza melodia maxima]